MSEEPDPNTGALTPSNDNGLSFFRQSLQLIAAFREIEDATLRQAVIRVIEEIAQSGKLLQETRYEDTE